jgi:hypothetical protein
LACPSKGHSRVRSQPGAATFEYLTSFSGVAMVP